MASGFEKEVGRLVGNYFFWTIDCVNYVYWVTLIKGKAF